MTHRSRFSSTLILTQQVLCLRSKNRLLRQQIFDQLQTSSSVSVLGQRPLLEMVLIVQLMKSFIYF